VLVTLGPPDCDFVAVTVTAPAVAALHVAVPRVESGALLILTFAGSETDHTASNKLPVMNAQPGGTLLINASKCCVFPGEAAVWSAVAVPGDTLMARIRQEEEVWPPQPDMARQAKVDIASRKRSWGGIARFLLLSYGTVLPPFFA
jgi:hypothetical protein